MINIDITLLIQLVNFLVTLVIINYLIVRPVRGVIARRRAANDELKEKAESLAGEASLKMEGYTARIAQARAEERRAMAVAQEQENKAKAQDARAKVIEAEAEVPLAMAEAFRSGRLGIMDYYRMQNIQADTKMREEIAKI